MERFHQRADRIELPQMPEERRPHLPDRCRDAEDADQRVAEDPYKYSHDRRKTHGHDQSGPEHTAGFFRFCRAQLLRYLGRNCRPEAAHRGNQYGIYPVGGGNRGDDTDPEAVAEPGQDHFPGRSSAALQHQREGVEHPFPEQFPICAFLPQTFQQERFVPQHICQQVQRHDTLRQERRCRGPADPHAQTGHKHPVQDNVGQPGPDDRPERCPAVAHRPQEGCQDIV